MNGEQKGGVKNHFLTLFRIIKKKLQKKKIEEEDKKVESEKEESKQRKDKIVVYTIRKRLQTKGLTKKVKNNEKQKVEIADKKEENKKIILVNNVNSNIEQKNSFNSNITEKKKNNPKPRLIISPKLKKRNNKVAKSIEKNNVKKNIDKNISKNIFFNETKNNELEESIINRINKIILDDKQDIDSLKYKLYEIDKFICNANDIDELDKLRIQFEIINEKIKKIKRDFEIIKDNLNFENYEEIENYFLLEEIDDFKFSNDFVSIELLSMKCKQQIDILDDIILVYEHATNTAKKIDRQGKQIEYFDKNTEPINQQTEKLDLITKKINNNLNLQNKFISDMNEKIGKSQKDVKIFYQYQGLNDLINNTLMMGLGVYSYSAMKRPRFRGLKFLIGSFLIYNSIRGMLNFLTPEMKKVTYIYYKDYSKELENESSRLILTNNLLNRSIQDIDILKREFKDKFMEYQYQLPDYDIIMEKIDKIQKQLKLQKQELNKIDKALDDQKEKNKEYIKKIEKIEE